MKKPLKRKTSRLVLIQYCLYLIASDKEVLVDNRWQFVISSSPEVGGGHMIRSISLAKALSRYVEIHFILDPGSEYWMNALRDQGFTSEILNKDNDIDADNICGDSFGILIDDYKVDAEKLLKWRGRCTKLAMIDDFGNAPSFVDYVISPGLSESKDNKNKQVNDKKSQLEKVATDK